MRQNFGEGGSGPSQSRAISRHKSVRHLRRLLSFPLPRFSGVHAEGLTNQLGESPLNRATGGFGRPLLRIV